MQKKQPNHLDGSLNAPVTWKYFKTDKQTGEAVDEMGRTLDGYFNEYWNCVAALISSLVRTKPDPGTMEDTKNHLYFYLCSQMRRSIFKDRYPNAQAGMLSSSLKDYISSWHDILNGICNLEGTTFLCNLVKESEALRAILRISNDDFLILSSSEILSVIENKLNDREAELTAMTRDTYCETYDGTRYYLPGARSRDGYPLDLKMLAVDIDSSLTKLGIKSHVRVALDIIRALDDTPALIYGITSPAKGDDPTSNFRPLLTQWRKAVNSARL